MLDGLAKLGVPLHLASTTQFSDQPWTPEAISALRVRGLEQIWVRRSFRGQGRLERWGARRSAMAGPDDYHFCSWWLRRWFDGLMRNLQPSTVVMHYAFADPLLNHERYVSVRRIIDMVDLVSVNRKIRIGIDQRIIHFIRTGEPGELFDVTLGWADTFVPDSEELAVYDRYDGVIAISRHEQKILRNHLHHAQVEWIPFQMAPIAIENTYDAAPLFIASANPFNQLGLLLLINRVLPKVRSACPDFRLDIGGDLGQVATPTDGVRYIGYLPNLEVTYQRAAFFVCPVFAGTGQQVKVIEAMAYSLPVVAFARTAADSPLRHTENSLIASNVDEFAEHLVTLWRDRALCRRLGTTAHASTLATDPAPAVLKAIIAA